MNTMTNDKSLKQPSANENKVSKNLKDYKTPTLTNYGDISELVLAMGGLGTDGNPIPSLSLT